MPAVFDEIFDTLSDGQYHTLDEIKFRAKRRCTQTNLNETQVEAVLAFLREWGFIKVLRQPGTMTRIRKVQLTDTIRFLLKRLEELEGVEAKEAAH